MSASNPAREALTRAVNRAIANGAPVYVNQPARPSVCLSCGHATAYGSTAGGCPCTEEDRKRAAQALASVAQGRAVL